MDRIPRCHVTDDQVALVLRKRTPYRIEQRSGKVIAWLDPWHGAAVKNGTVRATIPDTRLFLWYVIAVTFTMTLIELFWKNPNERSLAVENEIRDLFKRELGIKLS
jgi:hypothetical protein